MAVYIRSPSRAWLALARRTGPVAPLTRECLDGRDTSVYEQEPVPNFAAGSLARFVRK